jgi:hypothetical protein
MLFAIVVMELGLRLMMPGWNEYFSGRFMDAIHPPGWPGTSIGRAGFDGWFSQNNGDFRIHIHINQFGLRNDEEVEAAANRLWVVGDSFTFGWGVERQETYGAVMGQRLGLPSYNVASPGTGVCGWQTLLGRMPKDIRPAAVVVGLTVENRVVPMDCAADAKKSAESLAPAPSPGFDVLTAKMFLTEHFAIYNFFAVVLKRVDVVTLVLEKLNIINDARLVEFHNSTPEQLMSGLASTAFELERLRAMLAPGTPFVVMVIPTRFEIRDDLPLHREMRLGVEAEMAKRGIDYVDMIDAFKAVDHTKTSFAHDGHWTPLGHQIAAEQVVGWMKVKGKLP